MAEIALTYTDYAITQANAYVDHYKGSEKLAGSSAQETADINVFLSGNPYDNNDVRGAVTAIIKERIANKPSAAAGVKPDITYLSGAYGSNAILRRLSQNPESEIGKNVQSALENSVQSDFAAYKEQISKQLLEGQPVTPYAKWRPLLSGIDQAVQKVAEDKRLSQINDSTWALSKNDNKKADLAYLEQQGKNNALHMYAVALTPAQSAVEAKKMDISEDVAHKNARDFYETFPDLKAAIPNVTLIDKEGAVIYQQKDGKETQRDAMKMAMWQNDTSREAASQSNTLPTAPLSKERRSQAR